jgi:SOS-response transcriptional repressor LexA
LFFVLEGLNNCFQYLIMPRPPKPNRKGSPFADRLLQEMERWRLNQAWLATRLRISPGTVSGWFTKGATPQPRIAGELAELLGVEPAWLLHGREPKLNASSHHIGEQVVHGLTFAKSPALPSVMRVREVPLLSWTQADLATAPNEIPASWPERFPAAVNDGSAFAIQLHGDSMEPRYQEGDIAVVLPSLAARGGDLVVANIREEGFAFKILNFVGGDPGQIKLTSYNPVYAPMECPRAKFHWIYPVDSVTRRIRR